MRAALLLLLLLPMHASAAFDVYLEVRPASTNLPGESVDPLYAGWIDVAGFEMGAENQVTITNMGGPGFQGMRFHELTLVKKVDTATAPLFGRMGAGTMIASIRMVVAARTPVRPELWDIKGTTCFVSRQGLDAAGGGEVTERLSFVALQYEWSYIQLNPAGDATQEYFANWNLSTATGTHDATTRPPDFLGGVDTDSDGIPDGWELFYGLNKNVADGNLDTDHDGLTNLQEYIAHTNPLLSNSVLRITGVQKPGANTYNLSWQSVTGLTYRVHSATTPGGPYAPIKTVPSAGTGTTTTTITGPVPPLFLRVSVP